MMKSILKSFLTIALAAVVLSPLSTLQAQESEDAETGALFKKNNSLPPAYKMPVGRNNEPRTSEFLFTAQITGNASATTLAETRVSHAGKFAAVTVRCLGPAAAICAVPSLTRNSSPLMDNTILNGGQSVVIPFAEILDLDTSDTMGISGSCTITGAGSSDVSACVYELITPRHWQPIATVGQ